MSLDNVGKRYERLTVLREFVGENGRKRFLCECSCGKTKEFDAANVRGGKSKSCGCLQKEAMAEVGKSNAKHGQSSVETPEYRAWNNMNQRCHCPTHKQFGSYGGRGIFVADVWRADFSAFFAHAGKRPSKAHSLDRINNERGYEPGNVRWATRVEQSNNRRSNNFVEVDGMRVTLAEAIRLKGQRSNVVRQRLAIGWTLDRALNEPIVPRASRGRKKYEIQSERDSCAGG